MYLCTNFLKFVVLLCRTLLVFVTVSMSMFPRDWGWPFSACKAEVLLSRLFGYPSSIVLIADETGTNYFLTSKLHPVKTRATTVTVANGHTLEKLLQVRLLFVWVWELSICELWWPVAYWDDAFDSMRSMILYEASRLSSSG